MFKKNHSHLQIPLTSPIDELPDKFRKRIEDSWSGIFYRDLFYRIDETPFEVLDADCPTRPNIPVNVLVELDPRKRVGAAEIVLPSLDGQRAVDILARLRQDTL